MKQNKRLWWVMGYIDLVAAGIFAGPWLASLVEFDVRPSNEADVHRMVLSATILYIIASAVSFVSGADIGFALLAVMGAGIAPLVYLSMVVALSLPYLTGRLVPARTTAAGMSRLYSSTAFLVTVMIAVAPVPLLFLLKTALA